MSTPLNPIFKDTKSLTREGGGAGRSIYISADIIRQFDLEGTEEVDVFLTDDDGTLSVVVPLNKGFHRQGLVETLEEHGFELVHESTDEDFWSVAAKKDLVEVRTDSNARVKSTLLNNVSIRGPIFEVNELAAYDVLYQLASGADLSLGIDDKNQIWSRLQSTPGRDLSDVPEPDEIEFVFEEVDTLLVHFKKNFCSLTTTAPEVVNWAHKIQEVSETAGKKLGSVPKAPF